MDDADDLHWCRVCRRHDAQTNGLSRKCGNCTENMTAVEIVGTVVVVMVGGGALCMTLLAGVLTLLDAMDDRFGFAFAASVVVVGWLCAAIWLREIWLHRNL